MMTTLGLTHASRRPATRPIRRSMVQQTLLTCGILASLLYFAMLLVVPSQWEGYSSASQTVSELSAIDAPTRTLWISLGIIWTGLMIAFGSGIGAAAHGSRRLRLVGGLIIASAVIGLAWPPMHQREVLAAGGGTLTDTLHIVWTALTGILTLLVMFLAASLSGKRFRLYTFTTMGVLLAFGFLTGLDAPRLQANLPTPLTGVWERVNIVAQMLWYLVLAVVLLRRREPAANAATS